MRLRFLRLSVLFSAVLLSGAVGAYAQQNAKIRRNDHGLQIPC